MQFFLLIISTPETRHKPYMPSFKQDYGHKCSLKVHIYHKNQYVANTRSTEQLLSMNLYDTGNHIDPRTSEQSSSLIQAVLYDFLFHSQLKTYLFHKFFPRSFTSFPQTDFMDYHPDRFF